VPCLLVHRRAARSTEAQGNRTETRTRPCAIALIVTDGQWVGVRQPIQRVASDVP
jgi:hypothetical protein